MPDLNNLIRTKKSTIKLSFIGCCLAFSFMTEGCKMKEKSHRGTTKNPYGSLHFVKGNGLDQDLESALVWHSKELPRCFKNRVGVTFYVWSEQRNVSCNASGIWE